MANEIVPFETQLAELEKIQDTCAKLLKTRHYQSFGEAGIHAVISRAKTLGIHPFEALNNGFYCVNGRVNMTTEFQAALVRRKGHSISKDPKSNSECVILHGKRADNGDTWTCSFSKEDAERAGLWNTATWKKYPSAMLYNRCMSMLFRQLFPDLSLGLGYCDDEVAEITKTGDYETLEADVKPLYRQELPPAPKFSEIQYDKKPDVVRITQEQAEEMKDLVLVTDKDIAEKAWARCLKLGFGRWEDVTPEVYAKAKEWMLANPRKEEPRRSMDEVAQEEFAQEKSVFEEV